MSINTIFISKINRYESILTKQIKLDFVGTKPIRQLEKEDIAELYKKKLAKTSNHFLWSKITLLVVLFTLLGSLFWLQYGRKCSDDDDIA